MCDPLTISGIVLSAAGAGANYLGQQQVQSARDDALAAERIRQQALDQEAAALNTQSQDRYQNFEGQQQEKTKSLSDLFTAQPAEASPAPSLLPQSSSNITVQNESARKGEAKARTDQVGEARANLRAFGDTLGDANRLQARDASKVGQIGGFKKGSSNVLAYELEDANNAGGALSTIGAIASGLGRIGVGAGLSGAGGNLFGGATAASPMLSPATYGAAGSRALGGALDRASVPGYSGYRAANIFSMF